MNILCLLLLRGRPLIDCFFIILLALEQGPAQWCCVTELKVPSFGTSSNFDGTGTELVPFQK